MSCTDRQGAIQKGQASYNVASCTEYQEAELSPWCRRPDFLDSAGDLPMVVPNEGSAVQ